MVAEIEAGFDNRGGGRKLREDKGLTAQRRQGDGLGLRVLTVHFQTQRPLRRLVAEVAHPHEDLDVAKGGTSGGQGRDGLIVRFALADLHDGNIDRRMVGDARRIEDAPGKDDHLSQAG